MSWQNNLENIKFSIKTGDGKEFFPLLKITEKSVEFNTSSFDFIDVEKSLVTRKKAKSGKFPLTFWFQGDNNVEQAEEFEVSARDNRYWTVTHPFYGTIKGQPISLTRNDNAYNVTEVTVEFWETIIFDFPKSNLSIQDNTLVRKNEVLSASANSYSSRDVFVSSDIQKNKQSNALVAKSFEGIQTSETFPDYQNDFAKAQKSADNLLNNPNVAILDAQALLNGPSTYETAIVPRINAYKTAFATLVKTLNTISDKLFFESQGSTCIASYCNASVNFDFETDYLVVSEVEYVVSGLMEIYNQYLEILNNNSVSIYDVDNSFQPDALVQSQLSELVNFTIANLFQLAFQARQERIVFLPKDSNLILLTHKYLGLANDENIQRFREINNIKLKELFRLKKGRMVKYYV